MRRELLSLLPALSHFFGIQPWELDLLTENETAVYRAALAEIRKGA